MSKTTSSKKLVDSVYKRNIYVVIGSSKEVSPFLKRKFGDADGVDDYSDDANFIEYESGYVFWFSELSDSPASYGLIAHEVTHAVFTILTNIGIKYCDESEEAFCYYAGSITEQIVRFARK